MLHLVVQIVAPLGRKSEVTGGRGSSHMGIRIASVKEKLKTAPEWTLQVIMLLQKNWEFSRVLLFHFL